MKKTFSLTIRVGNDFKTISIDSKTHLELYEAFLRESQYTIKTNWEDLEYCEQAIIYVYKDEIVIYALCTTYWLDR